jgi:PIN domain nuclease of toxin-antitoxin system
VNYLLDTHLLVWSANQPQRLSRLAAEAIVDPANDLYFSAVSIWEVAIKQSLGRSSFTVDAHALRNGLLANGLIEMPLTGNHGIATLGLPPIHQDPFDRILISQAISENITLLTSDDKIAQYPGPIRKV